MTWLPKTHLEYDTMMEVALEDRVKQSVAQVKESVGTGILGIGMIARKCHTEKPKR